MSTNKPKNGLKPTDEAPWRKALREFVRGKLTDQIIADIGKFAESNMPKEASTFHDKHIFTSSVEEYGKFLLRTNFAFGYIRPKKIEKV